METKVMRLSEIKPAEYNPRVKLSEKDFEYKALRESITQFGLVVPLIVNERTGNLVGGHQRLSVLLEQGVEETEVVVIDVDEAREKAICVAMNKISGQWDYGKLADLLEELRDSADVDTLVTGFSDNEIGDLLGELDDFLDPDPMDTPEIEKTERKDNTRDGGTPCRIGEYEFKIPNGQFEDMMADIREKVGFSREQVNKELERRIFYDKTDGNSDED